jgi:DNA-binding IscR family transcriptional regulator
MPMVCAPEDEAHTTCVRGEYCSAQLLWTRIRDALANVLDSTILAELVPPPRAVGTNKALPLEILGSRVS